LIIPKDLLPKIKRTCAFDAKKVLDFRFSILVTRCERRSKKFLKLAVLGVQVTALLIEKRIGFRG
jgi:hypothetical protein